MEGSWWSYVERTVVKCIHSLKCVYFLLWYLYCSKFCMRNVICVSSPWHLWTWGGANCWFKNSSKKKLNPQLLFLLQWSQRVFFTSALVPDTAQAMKEPRRKVKSYTLHLLKKAEPKVEAWMLVPSHHTRGTALAHGASCGSLCKQWPLKDALGAPS